MGDQPLLGPRGDGDLADVLANQDGDHADGKKHTASIKAAVSGLNRLPVHHGVVYNGQKSWLERENNGDYDPAEIKRYVIGHYKRGTIIDNHNFLSTSTEIRTSFIPKPAYNVAWEISGLRTGRDIRPIADHPKEREVLFPPGARLIVNSVDTTQMNSAHGQYAGKLVVYLTEI